MRLILWLYYRFIRFASEKTGYFGNNWKVYRYIHKNPRRVGTHIFPTYDTYQIGVAVAFITLCQMTFFLILNWHLPLLNGMNNSQKFLNAWADATFVRAAGLTTINPANAHPGMQVLWVIMMYISACPVILAIRRTADTNMAIDEGVDVNDPKENKKRGRLSSQFKKLLISDLPWIFVPWFLVSIIEADELMNNPAYTLFAVLFDIVSAYGTSGLSLGYTNVDYSFSGDWHTLSKLVIIWVMIAGRRRGIADYIDPTINMAVSPGSGSRLTAPPTKDKNEEVEAEIEGFEPMRVPN